MKKKKKKKSSFKAFLTLLILIAIISGVLFGMKIYENGGGLQGFLLTTLGVNKKELDDLETIYVLVMGVSTDLEKELTDTIMLCGYNPKTNQAMMLSIPRDTFVGKNKNSAKGSEKINYLYSKGVQKTVTSVEQITGLDINYYAVVKTEILIQIVDAIGGVEFNVPINMKYDDITQDLHINLKKGKQIIDGKKAEMLLRFRHNNDGTTYPAEYGDNDYGRMRTQREFIKATVAETIKLKNITKIKFLLDTILNNLETNLKIEDILPYVPYAVSIDLENLIMNQLPGTSELCNNIWIYIHDKEKTTELITEITTKLEYGITHNEDNSNLHSDN